MEELDQRKRERMTKAIIFNGAVTIGILICIYIYMVPKYTAIGEAVASLNTTNAAISALKKDGVNTASFTQLLTTYGRKKEVPEAVFTNAEKLDTLLKKPATSTWEYLSWLVSENSRIPILEEEVKMNNRIIGSIIPVYANAQSASIADIENQITLTNFISYIEKDILSKYSLESYAPLWLGNITFSDEKKTAINIGTFQATISFKGKNNNIAALVETLQKSGKLTIRNGKLIPTDAMSAKPDGKLSDLSNLLVMIKSLTLDSLYSASSTDNNNGTLVLEFYVEGMNYQKILLLRTMLIEKFEGKLATNDNGVLKKDENGKTIHVPGLKENIKKNGELCSKPNPLCNEAVTNSAVAAIKNLFKNVSMMQVKIDAIKKNELITDVAKEMDNLFEIKNSLESMEIIYEKNASIIQKAKISTK